MHAQKPERKRRLHNNTNLLTGQIARMYTQPLVVLAPVRDIARERRTVLGYFNLVPLYA